MHGGWRDASCFSGSCCKLVGMDAGTSDMSEGFHGGTEVVAAAMAESGPACGLGGMLEVWPWWRDGSKLVRPWTGGDARFKRFCSSFMYSASSSEQIDVQAVMTDHMVVRGHYSALSIVVYGNVASDLSRSSDLDNLRPWSVILALYRLQAGKKLQYHTMVVQGALLVSSQVGSTSNCGWMLLNAHYHRNAHTLTRAQSSSPRVASISLKVLLLQQQDLEDG